MDFPHFHHLHCGAHTPLSLQVHPHLAGGGWGGGYKKNLMVQSAHIGTLISPPKEYLLSYSRHLFGPKRTLTNPEVFLGWEAGLKVTGCQRFWTIQVYTLRWFFFFFFCFLHHWATFVGMNRGSAFNAVSGFTLWHPWSSSSRQDLVPMWVNMKDTYSVF